MTAEVIVMNKNGVALAADSAVTISNSKVFNTANKLYMLSPNHSIGLLIFNNAEMMGISWELIIQQFREYILSKNIRFITLIDCANEFVRFLTDNGDRLFTERQQNDFVESQLNIVFRNDLFEKIKRQIQTYIIENAKPIPESEIVSIIDQTVNSLCLEWENSDLLDDVKPDLEKELEQRYQQRFNSTFDHYFGAIPSQKRIRDRLWRYFISWFSRNRWFLNRFTGFAFVGYGDDDLFPSAIVYNFESYVCGSLKHAIAQQFAINFDNHAVVIPLAQVDIVQTLLNGRHPSFIRSLEKAFVSNVSERYKDLFNKSDKDIEIKAISLAKQDYERVRQQTESETANIYTNLILHLVRSLPKDELAQMAETLVSITSFVRRVSQGLETVGGPTDVAVISKKDGFIWIKRKHYFDSQYNYDFFNRRSDFSNMAVSINELIEQLKASKDNGG